MFFEPLGTIKYLIYPYRGKIDTSMARKYKLPPETYIFLPIGTEKNIKKLPEPWAKLSSFNMLHLRGSSKNRYARLDKLKHTDRYILGNNCAICGASSFEQGAFPTCGAYQDAVQNLLLRSKELQLNPLEERKI